MGGKSKQAQRTKNNSRPSNSGRSAELLGSAIPSFVGFATHSDFGIVPLAPGFSTSESLPDTFDSTVSSQFQLILRKMSKKDPVTKVKALQEFADLISDSDIEVVKTILPLWPKFYHNLANDVEHRVREAAQNAQAAIVTKVGKSIAPYLKQLAPVWISSQFDNYAPVATIASTTFKSSFSSTKVQEVFTFCQNEIIDYITKNLTYHTASTLSNSKSGNSEEAENKYLRIVICSLKSLALFLKQTVGKYTSEIEGKLKVLLQNQKFWNFSKHKISSVRSAWFEALYSFLQDTPDLIESNKEQVIQITFLNMDDNDPLTLPNIWGCILLVQTVFSDWNKHVNFKKVLLPKLSSILKDGTCATAIHPNLLPFISKFSNETVPNYTLNEFYTNIFDNIKQSLTLNQKNSISKGDASATVSAFYECLRYVIQIKASECIRSNNSIKELNFCTALVNDYIIDILKWNIVNENITTKYVFLHISSLIAYWSQTSNTYPIYQELLKLFWAQLLKLIRENQELEENIDKYVKEFVEFIQNLYYAAPFPHDTKVKFSDEESGAANVPKKKNSVLPLQKDLKAITVELTRSMLDRMSNKKSTNYVAQLKILSDMFGDADFYCKITNKNNLYTAVELFTEFLMKCSPPLETIVDIIFEILMLLEKTERMDHLNKLLKVPNKDVQQWILQRLLSYPLCVEPEIRGILSQKHVTELIQNIASEVIKENSKEKFNLLHKCFFQIDSGEILINPETVEGITRIMSEPLSNESLESMLDTCGSFIAQIMPVICSINSTKELQRDIFVKLFRFSINLIESEHLSEDTLWEITTCWQDALSSNDITLDDELLAICCEIFDKRLTESDILSVPEINNIADMTAKLILCSTENITSEEERYKRIDFVIDKLLSSPKYLQIYNKIEDLCAYFELIEGRITLNCLNDDYMSGIPLVDVKIFFRKQLLNFSTIFKLTCNEKNEKQIELQEVAVEEDHEFTEDYFDPNEHLLRAWSDKIYGYIITSVNVAAIGESLMLNSSLISEEVEFLILNLSEKVNLVLNHSADCFISSIKSQLFSKIIENETSWTRTVPFLLSTNPFNKNENGSILLYEDSCNFVLENGNFLAYINITNIMLPKLEAKTLPVNYNVLMDNIDLIVKETSLRLFVTNHFTSNYNEISDRKIIAYCLDLITEVAVRQQTLNEFLLYNEEIDKVEFSKVTTVVEFINFLTKVLEKFPTELTIQHWDTVRLGLSSWVLSVSKSIERFLNPKVAMFTTAVYKLFAVLTKFIEEEKRKSSTQMLSNVIDEWQNLFSREVNLVLFKCFYKLVSNGEIKRYTTTHSALLDLICPCTEYLDYEIIFNACKSGFKISIDDILNFTLDHLSNELHSVRMASINITHNIAKFLITSDTEKLEKRPEIVDQNNSTTAPKDDWHYLSKFSPFIERYTIIIEKYLAEFSYKLTELPDLQSITHNDALPYLFLWDCIIYICSKAPAELRSLYAMWITENKYEHTLLNFLFRAMPVEILKNHDSKVMNNDVFKALTSTEVKDLSTTVERYACHFYTQTLRHLPAVVRKWWNATNTRQKTFVDKLTTNFVSNLICQEELRAIVNKKEKHENMQVTVHTSTREVVAVYSIDEARMELVITLAQNHPLGAVKVESGKQIGGRGQSRNVGMQLTIFLTHQNGSIFDGLSLWKKNLDKKFEGVEECYVCYTVIHQDTCQLPKLSCKTCKKKFHGPCLYKWFTTSSKSTCPICRNVF